MAAAAGRTMIASPSMYRGALPALPALPALAVLVVAFVLNPPIRVAAQDVPVLVHDEAVNGLYREASSSIESYTSTEASASLQIYSFRPFTGDLKQAFGSTLLRDWIDPQYRETAVDGLPTFNSGTLPGAEAVYGAQFTETSSGMSHPRLRLAILARQAVAVVDASAASALAWQRAWPSMQALLSTLKVHSGPPASTTGPPPSDGGTATATDIAGIFSGLTTRMVSDLTRGPGSFLRQPAVRYYLFSANGLVYRTFDQSPIPATQIGRFDFAAAARADPDNSGTYRLADGLLSIHLGGNQPETVAGRVTGANTLVIDSVAYERER